MCGRDAAFYTWKDVHAFSAGLPLRLPEADPEPNYNRAPTHRGWTIVADDAGGAAVEMRWGLLPSWAKDTKLAYSTINARLESCTSKPTFRGAWRAGRRCLVPASGYFEWKQLDPKTKQPFFIRLADAPVMFFAGLWEARPDGAGGELRTYTIITRDADPVIAPVHDRMPLILPPVVLRDWLHGSIEDAAAITLSAPEPPLEYYPVDRAVGNVRNTGPQLVQRLPEQAAGLF
jgi:putative SOS response-associated peptidase YedK